MDVNETSYELEWEERGASEMVENEVSREFRYEARSPREQIFKPKAPTINA